MAKPRRRDPINLADCPVCRICGRPLALGQAGVHAVCAGMVAAYPGHVCDSLNETGECGCPPVTYGGQRTGRPHPSP